MRGVILKLADLRGNMDGVYVDGAIAKKTSPQTIQTRFGPAMFATAILKDETGEIKLNLFRDQTSLNVGDIVRVENGFTKFGELNIGSRGKITVLVRASS